PWSAAKMLAYFARFNYLMVRSLTIRGAVGYYHQKQKNFPYRHSGRWPGRGLVTPSPTHRLQE
ncbi:MAG: hypothetical protein MJA30_05225, partial [Cytophagales bacterium]|nr:hypothetical protein [Cytophagales bacterium]